MDYPRLHLFLHAYLSPEESSSLPDAVRTFVGHEGKPAGKELKEELRRVLVSSGSSPERFRRLFEEDARFSVGDDPTKARELLLDLFASLDSTLAPGGQGYTQKPFDVFISYSTVDRQVASKLAYDLKGKGYSVWLDSWEILVGHNIVDEVFKGITESEFLIVVLSPASCKSKWVSEELSTARISEIEARRVVILPVLVQPCAIPPSLLNKRYADFTQSWEDGLRQLTAAIDLHRLRSATEGTENVVRLPELFTQLRDYRTRLLQSPYLSQNPLSGGSKDVAIGPPDGTPIAIARTQLASLVEACRVHIPGRGEPAFPYGEARRSDQQLRLPDGMGVLDKDAWPYETTSLHFWAINEHLQFLHRTLWREDYVTDLQNQPLLKDKLAVSWALMDIARPLMFALSLLRHEKRLGSLGVLYTWSGLSGRSLEIVNRRRRGFRRPYTSQAAEWTHVATVRLDSDLVTEASAAAESLFWLFQWDGAKQATEEDLKAILSGSVPS